MQEGTLVLRLAESGEGDPPALTPWAVRRVHGVDISRRRAELPRWLAQLERTLHGMSRQAADARQATRRALSHLRRAHGPQARETAARVEAALTELDARIAGRVPPDVLATVDGIGDTLRRAPGYADGSAHEDTVARIATDYLPTTPAVYLDLPQDWADPGTTRPHS